jgi:hypothetical protein
MAAWVDAVSATAIEAEHSLATPPAQRYDGNCRPSIRQQPWTAGDAVGVAVSPDEFARADVVSVWDKTEYQQDFTVWTGPIWTGLFVGAPTLSPGFSIRSTKVQVEYWPMRFHYLYEGVLTWNGNSYPVAGRGTAEKATKNMAEDLSELVHAAAQRAVMDAARQVKAIVAGAVPDAR